MVTKRKAKARYVVLQYDGCVLSQHETIFTAKKHQKEVNKRNPGATIKKLVPIDAYSRIQYECTKCGAKFMGDKKHVCGKGKK